MYKISVPITNLKFNKEKNKNETVELLKKMKAERVFLCVASNSVCGEKKEAEIKALAENAEYLHKHGFEVGAWFWTFYYTEDNDFIRMTSPLGKESSENICPTDERYTDLMFSFLRDVAETPVDLIMFDDDFRYGFYEMGFGCLCKNHYNRICGILNRRPDIKTVADGIMNGGRNEYRDAFLRANGEIFEEFAQKCRENVDAVDQTKRLGFCSCITSWDIDGTTPDRLAKILAGGTKPFYRLIGAPYWAALNAWGHRLSYVIEQERMESARRSDGEIEIFSEGDTFPRPRFRVPSAYLEGFDTALRADGTLDGILKYSFDYQAGINYERGYNENHIRNLPLYEKISRLFDGKEAVGLLIKDNPCKFNTVKMPVFPSDPLKSQEIAFSSTARFAAASSIPTKYKGGGVCMAFGEDARAVDGEDLKNGVILDFSGAQLLMQNGIDVGITKENGLVILKDGEYFADGEHISFLNKPEIHSVELSENAKMYSFADSEKTVPVFYEYENGDGMKFAVYTFDGYTCDDEIFRNYKRAEQIEHGVKFMNGRGLPLKCQGHPDLYILAKEKGNRISFGLWNFFPDKIFSPAVEFTENIKIIETVGADGRTEGNKVIFSDMEPYGTVFAEIEKL